MWLYAQLQMMGEHDMGRSAGKADEPVEKVTKQLEDRKKEPSTADTFALVGHEIRAEVIRVLGNPDNDDWDLSFGEIRRRLTVDAEPSQLHYHLEELLGHFIEKTADGYHLRPAGVHLCRALYAGTFGAQEDTLRVDADFDCHFCSAPVQAVFDTGHVAVVCSECGHTYTGHLFDCPLDAFADGESAFAHFRNYVIAKTVSLARGVCPSCTSQLDPAVHRSDSHPGGVCVHPSCGSCGAEWDLSVMEALFIDPGLVAFCFDHDVDVLSRPWWELAFAVTNHEVTVRSTDPWELFVAVALDGEMLEMIIGEELNVLERRRTAIPHEEGAGLPSWQQRDNWGQWGGWEHSKVGLTKKETCLKLLRRHRWPDEVVCPRCQSKNTIKQGTSKKGAQCYLCHDCTSTFNDLTGTIFAQRRLSLPEMFYIIREMDNMETTRLAKPLDRSYNSVLDFVHTVRDARKSGAEVDLSGLSKL